MRWLNNIRKPKRAVTPKDVPPAPDAPLYIIGDIHGCADRLEAILDCINLHIKEFEVGGPKLAFVGDYIDRGDQAAEVLSRVMDLWRSAPENTICLLGNHEKMMLDFLDRPSEFGRRWLRNGGLQTIASFGLVGTISEAAPEAQLGDIAVRLSKALPVGLEQWLRSLPMHWKSGNVVVVHAAADPETPIANQSEDVLLWGMPAFLRRPRKDGFWVVHGHTVVKEPRAENSRISVDTGAVFGGKLTAAAIGLDGDVSFLQV